MRVSKGRKRVGWRDSENETEKPMLKYDVIKLLI